MLLISLKPSIYQPGCVLSHMIWSDKGHPLQETTALLFVGDKHALQPCCGLKTNGLCCAELQMVMNSITFEAETFPVCVHKEESRLQPYQWSRLRLTLKPNPLVPLNPSLSSFLCIWPQVKPGWSQRLFHVLKLRGRKVCSHTRMTV